MAHTVSLGRARTHPGMLAYSFVVFEKTRRPQRGSEKQAAMSLP